MKKIKLILSGSQLKALVFIVNMVGVNMKIHDIQDMAIKEQLTNIYLKLQRKVLNLNDKRNKLTLSISEANAINEMINYLHNININAAQFEWSTHRHICREINQQIISM